MNVKSSLIIEITKDDRVFSFAIPHGAPFGQAYDAAHEVLQHIVELSKKAADAAAQNPEPAGAVIESKSDKKKNSSH